MADGRAVEGLGEGPGGGSPVFPGAGNPHLRLLPKALFHYSSRWCIRVPDRQAPEPAAFVSFGTVVAVGVFCVIGFIPS